MQLKHQRGFASDNNAGVHPEILTTLQAANNGHTIGYGDDPYTTKAIQKIKDQLGRNVEVFLIYNGTAANVLGIKAVTKSYNSVICAETAHIHVDECGAPEKFTGCKLLTVATKDGKLTVDKIRRHLHGFDFEHHAQPRVISITQATELGTVYTAQEIRQIADLAHSHDMLLHMDGARIGNAAVSLGVSLRETTFEAGVDVLSFGGTKNGMMFGEALVFADNSHTADFKYFRKQGMQLASKMRYIAVQFDTLLSNDLWYRSARHANEMAQLLAKEIENIPQIRITQKVQTNGVFAIVPPKLVPLLQQEYFFYVWDEQRSEVRWMTSFDTTEEDVHNFVEIMKKLLR